MSTNLLTAMVRVGVCLIHKIDMYEDDLIDHIERDHAKDTQGLTMEQYKEWLRESMKVEDRMIPPGKQPWIQMQHSKIRTGVGGLSDPNQFET